MNHFHIEANAKINLGLDVLERLPNGYHRVKMVMQSINLCDKLFLSKAESGIHITTNLETLPTDESNLVYKAVKMMFEKHGITSGVNIHIKKFIPMAAGLAGGSSDAAAAMKGICRMFDLDIPLQRLMEYGASIGADVPFCLMGGTALAEGIGEELTPLPPLELCHILIATPEIEVSTKYVYEHLNVPSLTRHPDIDSMLEAIRAESLMDILPYMENVLETVTIPAYPVIRELKEKMLEMGAANSLMSGSGPTVFGFFPDGEKGSNAFRQFKNAGLAKHVFYVVPTQPQRW